MNKQIFNIPYNEAIKSIESLKSFLLFKDYSIREFLKHDGFILQIRRGGRFKTIMGLSVGLNINVEQNEKYFTLHFSEERWVDKIVVAAISLCCFWPFLITSSVGAYKQSKLPNEITEYINAEVDKYFRDLKKIVAK